MVAVMTVETWDSCSFTPAQAQAIGELIALVWPKPHLSAADRAQQQLAIGRQYHGPAAQAPRSFVVVEDGRVVAHAAILPRTVATSCGELTIAGLARVCTDPHQRGRGLGELVSRAAFDAIDGGDFPFLLFQASDRVRAFYEKLGAVVVENPIVNLLAENPAAPAFWDDVVMRYPANGDWPQGAIDLRGPGY